MFNTQNDDGQEFGDLISLAVANGLGCKRVDINLHYYETLRLLEYYGGYQLKTELYHYLARLLYAIQLLNYCPDRICYFT